MRFEQEIQTLGRMWYNTKFRLQGDKELLIQVSKEEARKIREKFPDVYVAKTKHKYYVPEIPSVLVTLSHNDEAKAVLARNRKRKR